MLAIFKDLYRKAKHKVSKLVHTAKCKFYTEGIALASSSKEVGSTHDVTSHLQRIQNYAARVILRLPKSSSITIHLRSLHCLPVKVRRIYTIACLCYHCHSSTAPSYVTDMLHRKPLHTRNTRTNSYTMPLLNRPAHSKAALGDCSFSFASSSVWNYSK